MIRTLLCRNRGENTWQSVKRGFVFQMMNSQRLRRKSLIERHNLKSRKRLKESRKKKSQKHHAPQSRRKHRSRRDFFLRTPRKKLPPSSPM